MNDDERPRLTDKQRLDRFERVITLARMIGQAIKTLRIPLNDELVAALRLQALAYENGPEWIAKLPYEEAKAHVEFILTDIEGQRR